MSMKNPPHPGKVVRVSCLEPLGLNVTEGAKVLGVSRQALSNLVNGRARMSIDMAVRLAKAFGSTTETWIRLQAAYDVAQAQTREDKMEVERHDPQPPERVPTSPLDVPSVSANISTKEIVTLVRRERGRTRGLRRRT